MMPQDNIEYAWYKCATCEHLWYGPVLDVSIECPLDRQPLVETTYNETDIEKVVNEVLAGIDETETKEESGWWETNAGADFGKRKKEELLNKLRLIIK